MKVFHGSYALINEIDLSKCELQRDFGKAFYVTNIREQALFWAQRKGSKHGTEGIVTEFIFLESAFNSTYFKTLKFDDYSEDWLDFVIENRKNETSNNIHDFDIIEGPVADDAIATRIAFYMRGGISKKDFLEDLKFKHSKSHQLAFCTEKSLLMLMNHGIILT